MQDMTAAIADKPRYGASHVDWNVPRDLITEQLQRDGRLVITDNDRPLAIMLKIDDSTLEDTMLDISRVQALRALKAAQANAVRNGLCNMTLEEINATIAAARAERKPR